MGAQSLGFVNLASALVLVVASAAVLHVYRAGLSRQLAWATFRTVVQLLLVGEVLRWVFVANHAAVVVLALCVMISVAAWTAARRSPTPVPGLLGLTGLSLAIGAGGTTLAVTALVVRADPWWEPRYLLPLSGMIVGNAMNGAALAAERLQSEIAANQGYVEELLALGASPQQATLDAFQGALRAALTPTINAMLTVGLVSLPGMMTGQMIAGEDPSTAARYQIVVMFMLTAAVAVSSVMLTVLIRRRYFTKAWQLRAEFLQS